MGDLLHALGWSLWTGAVVAVFVQIIPEMKRRQISQTLDDYEVARGEKVKAAGNREGNPDATHQPHTEITMSTRQMSHEHATQTPAPVTVDPTLKVVPEEAADAGAGQVPGARR